MRALSAGKHGSESTLASVPDTPRVAAIVLAAGGSSRLGAPKQLVRYQGEMLVRRAVRVAQGIDIDLVVVVVGGNAEQVMPELIGIPGVHPVINEKWKSGLASSCVTGLQAVQAVAPETDGVALMLADQPLVDEIALRRLLGKFDKSHRVVAAVYEEIVGVPAIVGKEYFPEILELAGETDARHWLHARAPLVTPVPTPEAAFDVDTPEDVAMLTRRMLPAMSPLPRFSGTELEIPFTPSQDIVS